MSRHCDTTRVLIIGGYGHFGRLVAEMLAADPTLQIIISGRNNIRAAEAARRIDAHNVPETAYVDVHRDLSAALANTRPDIVIHTAGPYQAQDYAVPRACIAQGCHYIDLADGRDFVSNITVLDEAAKGKGVLICSGASSVPALTAAIVDHYRHAFQTLDGIDCAITTAQRSSRGRATAAAALSYAGKPFEALSGGEMKPMYGWLGLRFRRFRGLNRRPLGNCDIPDLAIFPARYPSLKSMRFQAGLELAPLHLMLVGLAWLVRLKLLPSLQPLAPYLLRSSRLFDAFGSENSGFYMELSGSSADGERKTVLFEIVARDGDGAYIPAIAAVLMARKLAAGDISATGACPCVGFITLDELLDAFRAFDIAWWTDQRPTPPAGLLPTQAAAPRSK